MDKTTTPAASAAKTAQDTIREALDQGSLCSNVAYNLGQHREDSEQILGTVRKFDELRLAALASLKSLDGQAEPSVPRLSVEEAMEVVKEWALDWCDWSVIASDDGKDLRERLTKATKP